MSCTPDFGTRMGEGFDIHPAHDGGASHVLMPSRLELAQDAAGAPDFSLEVVRSHATERSQLHGYGVLDFRVRAGYRYEAASDWLARHEPGATLAQPPLGGGVLRFEFHGPSAPLAFCEPAPLAWNGLGLARYRVRLDLEAADWLAQRLKEACFPSFASADIELEGVAPRLPLAVSFDPQVLVGALLGLARPGEPLERDRIVAFFRTADDTVLQASRGLDGPARDSFAETMTDRIVTSYGRLAPVPGASASPLLALQRAPAGRETWDLAETRIVRRCLRLRLDPFDAQDSLGLPMPAGRWSPRVHASNVPPMTLGHHAVRILTNLPQELAGVLGLRVALESLPGRQPGTVTETDVTHTPDTSLPVTMGVVDPLRYLVTTSAVFEASGPRFEHRTKAWLPEDPADPCVLLGPRDFAALFVETGALPSLVQRAAIHVVCRATSPSCGELEIPFDLTAARPSVAAVLPDDAVSIRRDIDVTALDGSGQVVLQAPGGDVLRLSLWSLPGHGTQSVDIVCEFPPGGERASLELLPEGEAEHRAVCMPLRAGQPGRTWTYRPRSPFRCGYRYRWTGTGAWSAVQSPPGPLRVSAPQPFGTAADPAPLAPSEAPARPAS